MLSRSRQEYKFTAHGMSRTGSAPLTMEGQHSVNMVPLQVSEKDVTVLKRLGSGASSVVLKGFHWRANRFVAIKKINEKRTQLMNDVKALSDAPPSAGLIEFVGAYHTSEDGQIAVVLEYMDGGSLGDVLGKAGRVSEPVLAALTRRILTGLLQLHKGRHTVHRDIKPANILLTLGGKAKISDFGISAFVDNTLAVCHTYIGTVTYMSPERINSQPYSFPADIWSLGLTLLEAVTGRYPYDASVGPLQLMIQVVEDDVPFPAEGACTAELQDLLRKCLCKDPLRRLSAEALLRHPWLQQ
eukprot:jgi/Astpho2/6309/gw1.00090.6.1_t